MVARATARRRERAPAASATLDAPESSKRIVASLAPLYRLGKAPHVGSTRIGVAPDPKQDWEYGFENVDLSLEELVELLTTHETREKKDGTYITRPMGGDERTDANAEPWLLVPLDVDELAPEELPTLRKWFSESNLQGTISTTFSHREDRPKIRLMLFASRETTADEHAFVFRAMEAMVPFKLDPCMAKPSQPIFLPACPRATADLAFAEYVDGDPLDIDRLLDAYREEIEAETRRRAESHEDARSVGVRQPGGLIDWFNSNYDLPSLLVDKGYRRKSNNRYVAPESQSGRAAVILGNGGRTVVSFHDPEHDPLAVRNDRHQAIVLDAFAVFCKLQHKDNFKEAFQGALAFARSAGWEGGAAIPAEERIPQTPAPLLNAEELYGSLQPQDMLIEGVLDANTVTIVAGDSNSGKTTVLQHMTMQVALGEPFAAKRTKQGIVLWIAGEDIENVKYRVVAMCEEHHVDPQVLGDSFLLLPQPIAILDADSMLALHDVIRERIGDKEIALIVVDSKSVNWGGKDENSNDENAQFIMAVRKFLIAPFGRPSVLITHHLTKQKEKEARSSRGGSALINNADHEWRFEMNQESKTSVMMPGSKVRMERWAEIRFQIKVVSLPEAKLPQLVNNFGDMPRVSIADPVNQYARSMKQIQLDNEMRAALAALDSRTTQGLDTGTSALAKELSWNDGKQEPDYRKVKRVLSAAERQKLCEQDAKTKIFTLTEAGKLFISEDAFSSAATADAEEIAVPEDDHASGDVSC